MGKQIIRISRWSCRSVFKVYSRIMTLIFALFCAATGQLTRSASAKRTAATNFKGTAYRASDSTVLKNIKLFLTPCMLPEYGIAADYGIVVPMYGPSTIENVTTDENGYFRKNVNITNFTINSEEVIESSGRTRFYSSGCIQIRNDKDSTYTLYLQEMAVDVKEGMTRPQQASVMTILQGNQLQIHIPEWKDGRTDATIINSKGQKITDLSADKDGILRWDTSPAAKGVYFLKLRNKKSDLSVKILVR